MIWLLCCLACNEVTQEQERERQYISTVELDRKLLHIGNYQWSYPTTGMVLSYDEKSSLFMKAKEAKQAKEYEEAAKYLLQLLKEEPENVAVHSFLAAVLLSMGDVGQAKIAAEKALEYQPSAVGYINLATVHLAANEYDKAREYSEKALEYDRKFFLALRNLSSLYFAADDYDKAEEYIRKLLRIAPDDSYVYTSLAQILIKKGKLAEAREVFQYRLQELEWRGEHELRNDSGMSLELPIGLAEVLFREGKLEQAEHWFEKTITLSREYDGNWASSIQYEIVAKMFLIRIAAKRGDSNSVRTQYEALETLIEREDTEKDDNSAFSLIREKEQLLLLKRELSDYFAIKN